MNMGKASLNTSIQIFSKYTYYIRSFHLLNSTYVRKSLMPSRGSKKRNIISDRLISVWPAEVKNPGSPLPDKFIFKQIIARWNYFYTWNIKLPVSFIVYNDIIRHPIPWKKIRPTIDSLRKILINIPNINPVINKLFIHNTQNYDAGCI